MKNKFNVNDICYNTLMGKIAIIVAAEIGGWYGYRAYDIEREPVYFEGPEKDFETIEDTHLLSEEVVTKLNKFRV